jgi:hypothetical protein
MNFLKKILLAVTIFSLSVHASHLGLFFQQGKKPWPTGADGAITLSTAGTYTVQKSTSFPGKLLITNGTTNIDNIGSFTNASGVNDSVCLFA